MRLILSQAQQYLAEYTDYGACPTDPRVTTWINWAVERLLPVLNPEKTLARYVFPVLHKIITLPPEIKTVLAANLNYPCPPSAVPGGSACANCGDGYSFLLNTVSVRNRWYEMIPGGPAGFGPNSFIPCSPNVLMDMGTGYSTIADACTMDNPQIIRVYADLPQVTSEGFIFINGLDAEGNQLISYDSAGVYHQALGIAIPIQGQNFVDSTVQISQINTVTKPITKGRIRLYAVDPNTQTQVPIGIYAPTDVAPDYRRYRLTWCGAQIPNSTIVLQCKRQFIWTTDPDADLLVTNIGALQEAMMGIRYSKAGSVQLAEYHFQQAAKILEQETIDYDTDKVPSLQMQNFFAGGDIWNLR
jgi:hypothetical protein